MLDGVGDVSNAMGGARAQANPGSLLWPSLVQGPQWEMYSYRGPASDSWPGVTLAGGTLPGTSGFGTSKEGSFIGCFCDVSTCTKVEKSMNAASGMMSVQRDLTLNGCSPREGWALRAKPLLSCSL